MTSILACRDLSIRRAWLAPSQMPPTNQNGRRTSRRKGSPASNKSMLTNLRPSSIIRLHHRYRQAHYPHLYPLPAPTSSNSQNAPEDIVHAPPVTRTHILCQPDYHDDITTPSICFLDEKCMLLTIVTDNLNGGVRQATTSLLSLRTTETSHQVPSKIFEKLQWEVHSTGHW